MLDPAIITLIEKNNLFNQEKVEVQCPINSEARLLNDKALNIFLAHLKQSHNPSSSKIISEDEIRLPEILAEKISEITSSLNLTEDVKSDINKLTTKLYSSNIKNNIEVSKTSDGELVIYSKSRKNYKNILIDEDGDIELVLLPEKGKASNIFYSKETGINFSKIVRTFNEMH